MMIPKIIAHRGISVYEVAENTLPALRQALELGFTAETDVQILKDRKYVLFHDDFIPGEGDKDLNGGGFFLPSGKKPVAECTLDELLLQTRFDRARHEAILAQQAAEPVQLKISKDTPRIATLKELIELVKEFPNSTIFLEIKRQDKAALYDDGLEKEIIEMIVDNGLQNNFMIQSFNEHSLRNSKNDKGIPLGALVYKDSPMKPFDLDKADRLKNEIGISYWNPTFSETNEALKLQTDRVGLKIASWVWPENKKTELIETGRLSKLGVNLITNQAREVQRLI